MTARERLAVRRCARAILAFERDELGQRGHCGKRVYPAPVDHVDAVTCDWRRRIALAAEAMRVADEMRSAAAQHGQRVPAAETLGAQTLRRRQYTDEG